MATETPYSMTATVLDDSPLTIIADGAETSNTAIKAADVGAVSLGARVEVTVRNPQQPLITNIEVNV